MPNHVQGQLEITGNSGSLRRLAEMVKDDEEVLSAHRIIPYPYEEQDRLYHDAFGHIGEREENDPERERKREEYKQRYPQAVKVRNGYEHVSDGYNCGGYNWCVQNWGTKWGFYSTEKIEDTPEKLVYRYRTAWSPPLPLIERLSSDFPELRFKVWYEDEGWCFPAGFTVIKSGETVEEFGWECGDPGYEAINPFGTVFEEDA